MLLVLSLATVFIVGKCLKEQCGGSCQSILITRRIITYIIIYKVFQSRDCTKVMFILILRTLVNCTKLRHQLQFHPTIHLNEQHSLKCDDETIINYDLEIIYFKN